MRIMTRYNNISPLDDSTALFTVGDYKAMLAETEAMRVQVIEIKAIIEKNERVMSQMKALVPALEDIKPPQESPPVQSPSIVKYSVVNPTWTGEILKTVEMLGATDLATLKSQIRKGPLKDRIKKTDGGFYGGIKRLVERKKIVRVGDTLYSLSAYESGDVKPQKQAVQKTVPQLTLEALEGKPEGLIGARVTDALRQQGMDSHENYIYSVLGRLRSRGDVIQNPETKAYRLKKYKHYSNESRSLI